MVFGQVGWCLGGLILCSSCSGWRYVCFFGRWVRWLIGSDVCSLSDGCLSGLFSNRFVLIDLMNGILVGRLVSFWSWLPGWFILSCGLIGWLVGRPLHWLIGWSFVDF